MLGSGGYAVAVVLQRDDHAEFFPVLRATVQRLSHPGFHVLTLRVAGGVLRRSGEPLPRSLRKPVLAPRPALLRRAPQLHRVNRIAALHHHALEEIAAKRAVRGTQPLIERQRIGV